MTIGKETFGLGKGEYSTKLGRVIDNHRANSKLAGEPREFILRSCRLCDQWSKLAGDPDVVVYLRYVNLAGGRTVKMLSLERSGSKQPVSKSKLVDALYPAKKIATTATPEEKHFNAVKSAMRNAVNSQLSEYRESVILPITCYLSGKRIRRGMRTDVDHVADPFSKLCDDYLVSKDVKYTDIALCGPPTAKRFKDDDLWFDWKLYHLHNAKYALVCASANRSKGNDGYATPLELYGSFKAETAEDLSLDF